MSDPYRVEKDEEHSCAHCLRAMWNVIGPDGTALGISYNELDDAEDMATMLTNAHHFALELAAKSPSMSSPLVEDAREVLAMRDDARDAERYRWLRSEHVNTDPLYYDFWRTFGTKLCREEGMDRAIDAAMKLSSQHTSEEPKR